MKRQLSHSVQGVVDMITLVNHACTHQLKVHDVDSPYKKKLIVSVSTSYQLILQYKKKYSDHWNTIYVCVCVCACTRTHTHTMIFFETVHVGSIYKNRPPWM